MADDAWGWGVVCTAMYFALWAIHDLTASYFWPKGHARLTNEARKAYGAPVKPTKVLIAEHRRNRWRAWLRLYLSFFAFVVGFPHY